jgi:hypothetical protein
MLHPELLYALLDEVVVIHERLASRGVSAERDCHRVLIRAPALGADRVLILR